MTNTPHIRPLTAAFDVFAEANLHGLQPEERETIRTMYMAGADDVLRLILGNLAAGDEPTDGDLQLMDAIEADLKAFADELKRNGVPWARKS